MQDVNSDPDNITLSGKNRTSNSPKMNCLNMEAQLEARAFSGAPGVTATDVAQQDHLSLPDAQLQTPRSKNTGTEFTI